VAPLSDFQSKIAVGDGGVSGRGQPGNPDPGDFLPSPTPIFISARFSEEPASWARFFVLLIYFLILMAFDIKTLRHAAYPARFVPGNGVAAVLIFQIAVNVGMFWG